MKKVLFIMILLSLTVCVPAQTVQELMDKYSGNATWNASNGTLTFTGSGKINFNKTEHKNAIWDVPTSVKTIIINENVQVTGCFHTTGICTIKGNNRKTSVVFGTEKISWSKDLNLAGFEYSLFENKGGVLRIENLTCLNPFAYHVRGYGTDKVIHVKDADFLDTRGGAQNNSDGIVGGDGSTVDNCYFETGDDVIKVYFDITVTNTHIKMVQNTVPIQLGWGDYSNGARGTFRNLTITGNSGRGPDGNAVIVGRTGKYTVRIDIDGCDIRNPNATWLSLRENSMTLNGTVTDAYIKINKYWDKYLNGTNNMIICDTDEQKAFYECLNTPISHEAAVQQNEAPQRIKVIHRATGMSIDLGGINQKGSVIIHNLQGRVVYTVTVKDEKSIVIHKRLRAGVYLVRFVGSNNLVSGIFTVFE